MSDNKTPETVNGYEVKRAIAFDCDRGIAYGENPNAPERYGTWQFTEDKGGGRDYYWGHYTDSKETALRDYEVRVSAFREVGVHEKDAYRYYTTQRPSDIGAIPKTEFPPFDVVGFDTRQRVEKSAFHAWGYVVYDTPLTEKQIADYELRAAPDNPDVRRRMSEQAQTVGAWEEKRKVPGNMRLTWWYPDFGSFVPKEFVTPEQMQQRYDLANQKQARPKSIGDQMKEGAQQAAKGNAALPPPSKNKTDKDLS